MIHDISHLPFDGEYIKDEHDKYVAHIVVNEKAWKSFTDKYSDVKVIISPFSNKDDKWVFAENNEHDFRPIYCQQVSAFIRICIVWNGTEKEFLLHLPIIIPVERHGKIMAEILDNEEKIMRYLMFCLDSRLDTEMQKIGYEQKFRRQSVESSKIQPYSLPIYERLLLAASRDKTALAHIKENVERLKNVKGRAGKPLLSKAFLDMWNKFSVYAK